MTKDDYDQELARLRLGKMRELSSIPKRLERADRDRLQRLMAQMKQGGPDWAPGPDDGQWLDKTHRDHFAKRPSNTDLKDLDNRARQEWVMDNLTETNRRRLLSILETPVDEWTQKQINWLEKVVIEAEMKAEDDGED